jgi:hypothetical protein
LRRKGNVCLATRHNTEPPDLHIKKHSLTVHDHYTVYIVKIREYSFEKESFLRERERLNYLYRQPAVEVEE